MEYLIITKDYGDNFAIKKAEGEAAANREILAAISAGKEPDLAVVVDYKVSIKIGEVPKVETHPSKTKRDKGPGPEGHGPDGPGDGEPVPEVDEGDRP